MDLTENILNDAIDRYPNEYPKKVSPETLREIANMERRAYIRGREDERKLRESQNSSTSDEALHIGSVVKSLPDETCSASNCNGFIFDGKCDRCG